MCSKSELLRAIRHEVEECRAYLDPGLTLSALAARCETNRTYVSQVLVDELGGFFDYVNGCRIAHFNNFRRSHPSATIEQATRAAGFRNRQTYYNALRRLMAGS